jgi:hypothetical protein
LKQYYPILKSKFLFFWSNKTYKRYIPAFTWHDKYYRMWWNVDDFVFEYMHKLGCPLKVNTCPNEICTHTKTTQTNFYMRGFEKYPDDDDDEIKRFNNNFQLELKKKMKIQTTGWYWYRYRVSVSAVSANFQVSVTGIGYPIP